MNSEVENTIAFLKIAKTIPEPKFGSVDLNRYTARQTVMDPAEAQVNMDRVIETVREISPFRIGDLQTHLGIDKSQANVLIDYWETRGIATRDFTFKIVVS